MSADDVRTTVAGVVHDIDGKRWRQLRARFPAEVDTDYTSLFGGAPVRQSGDALIAGWRDALERVATQHLLGPIEVRFELARGDGGWTIARMVLDTLVQTGNRQLLAEAKTR